MANSWPGDYYISMHGHAVQMNEKTNPGSHIAQRPGPSNWEAFPTRLALPCMNWKRDRQMPNFYHGSAV